MSRTYRRNYWRYRDGGRKENRDGDVGMTRHNKDWNRLMNNVPKRRKNKQMCKNILKGKYKEEEMTFPLGNRKPHVYYW